MIAFVGEPLTTVVADVLRNAPEWARHDLASREISARLRAEETLAVMIAAALAEGQPSGTASAAMAPDVPTGPSGSDLRSSDV